MDIRSISEKKGAVCEKVLRSLPNWFGIEKSILDYISDSEKMFMLGAFEGADLLGFVSLNTHNKSSCEIHVKGVLPSFQRKGVGKLLVSEAEQYLLRRGYDFLTVKTLSPSRKDRFYEKTLQFYNKMGFRPLEEFRTLWGEANPCLFMVKTLSDLEGRIHHVELYVSNLEKSLEFWSWFLSDLGYHLFQDFKSGQSWRLDETYIVFVQTEKKHLDVPYHRCKTGLNHLAFHAKSDRYALCLAMKVSI